MGPRPRVDFGPDQLDWEFCLDDLSVRLTENGERTREDGGGYERQNQVKRIEQEEL